MRRNARDCRRPLPGALTIVRHYRNPVPVMTGEVVQYTVQNTGRLPLTMVGVRLKAICEDGTSYQETWATFDLDVKQAADETVWITTNGSTVVEVKIMDIETSTF